MLNATFEKHKEAFNGIGITSMTGMAQLWLVEINKPVIRAEFFKRKVDSRNAALKKIMDEKN